MICDTCGKESPIVSRVVIDKGYNRANARAVYNCPECFERKNSERSGEQKPDGQGSSTAHPESNASSEKV